MGKSVTATHRLLDAEEWTARAADYRSRVDQFLAPHCKRRGVGQLHPV